MTVIGSILMLVGALLSLIAGIGVVRLPSALTRLHAAAKPASLGLALVAFGAGLTAGSVGLMATAVVVAVFQFLTAPIAGHLLGRSLGDGSWPTWDVMAGSTSARTMRRWPIVVETVLVWIALWRDLSPANLAGGVALGVLLSLLAPPRLAPPYTRPLAAAIALARYGVSLLRSNVRMARQVLTVPDRQLRETVVVCDLTTRSESVAFFDANATSFSPGTLTLEMSSAAPYRMLVHAMGQTEEEVRAEVASLEASASRVYE
ncbi:MAG: monovalent cation/H(+) antiporter subunit G [Acidimicrobiia bacterium]|jgi:multicomponent Na+:H+ antiporter subunit G